MGGGSDTGFHIFMALLGVYFVGMLLWSLRNVARDIASWLRTPKAIKKKKEPTDGRLMWTAIRTARRGGASLSDSIQAGIDTVKEFQKTGKVVLASVPDKPPPAPSTASRTLGIAQAILVNGVTLTGVYRLRWPIGTALALYWSETLIATLLLIIFFAVLRYGRGVNTSGGSAGQMIAASLVFTAAHFVFLLFFLAVILPRYSVAERFDRLSFQEGLIFIALLLVADFLIRLSMIRKMTAADLEQTAALPMQRMGVMHLTIIFGMFALLIFGNVRAFFAVFCALKILVDLSRGA